MAALWLALAASIAAPDPSIGPARVGVGRVSDFLLPLAPLTPRIVYPEGKQSSQKLDLALRRALAAFAGEGAANPLAQIATPFARIGIQIDCTWPPVSLVLLDVLIDQLVRAGASPDNIYVFGPDDNAVFKYGLRLKPEGPGVKVTSAARAGFRGGITRVVLDYCDVVINLSRLKAHRRLGMWGALANMLTACDYTTRYTVLSEPERLCEVACRLGRRGKVKLHIIDALQPAYEPADRRPKLPPRWPYGGIIVGTDPVACDLVGWRLLEAKRAEVAGKPNPLKPRPDYILAAGKRYRVGQVDLAKITVAIEGPVEGALLEPGPLERPQPASARDR